MGLRRGLAEYMAQRACAHACCHVHVILKRKRARAKHRRAQAEHGSQGACTRALPSSIAAECRRAWAEHVPEKGMCLCSLPSSVGVPVQGVCHNGPAHVLVSKLHGKALLRPITIPSPDLSPTPTFAAAQEPQPQQHPAHCGVRPGALHRPEVVQRSAAAHPGRLPDVLRAHAAGGAQQVPAALSRGRRHVRGEGRAGQGARLLCMPCASVHVRACACVC